MFRARRPALQSSEARSPSATPPPTSSPPSSPERGSSQLRADSFTRSRNRRRNTAVSRYTAELPASTDEQSLRESDREEESIQNRSERESDQLSVILNQFNLMSGYGGAQRPLRRSASSALVQEAPSRGRSPARQATSPSMDLSVHTITQLRPQDARRSRRNDRGRSLFLPSSRQVVLALPGGRMYAQSTRSQSSRSSSASSGHRGQLSLGRSHSSSANSSAASPTRSDSPRAVYQPDDWTPAAYNADNLMSEIIVSIGHAAESPEDRRAREHAKKERQVTRWVNEVIPALLRPYMQLLRSSQSLRSVQRDTTLQCSCVHKASRSLKVTCIYFDRKSLHLFDPRMLLM